MIAQYGWLQLCNMFAIGMTLTILWKNIYFGFNREHFFKDIKIREYSKFLARGCFVNPFFADTRTPDKNIPHLGVVGDEEPVATRHCIVFPISSILLHRKSLSLTSLPTVSCHQPLLCPLPLFIHSILFHNLKIKRGGGKWAQKITVVQCYPMEKIYKRTIWFCTGCLMVKNRAYYCKQFRCDCFEARVESLLDTP